MGYNTAKTIMKMLLFIFTFILFGFQTTFHPIETNTSHIHPKCIVTDTDDICSCCSKEWQSQTWGDKKIYEVRFKNSCSYSVTISYKYRSDNGKLVPCYAQVGAGKTSSWYPAGYEKQLYSYSEE